LKFYEWVTREVECQVIGGLGEFELEGTDEHGCMVLWQGWEMDSDSAGCCSGNVSVIRACGQSELGLMKACSYACNRMTGALLHVAARTKVIN